VILLHAFPLDGSMWPPGLGEPVDYPGSGSLAGWMDELAGRLERPALVCGLSMGGYAAFELVRRHPGLVRGLVLADTKAEPDTQEQREARDENIEFLRREGPEALIARLAPGLFRQEPDEEALERTRAIVRRQPPARLVAMLEALRDRADSSDVVGRIAVPTLVVCGAEDALTPPAAMRALAASIRSARYVEVAGAGHLSAVEQPARFSEAVRAFAEELAGA
jgi:pimeloyl-ACP methyl ester carboxylesterase